MKAKLLALTISLCLSLTAFSQGGYKGSITAEIQTQDGSPLPGAVAELTAETFARSFVSDANGLVRFVGLTPDVYQLRVTFTGFNTYVRPNLVVDTGQNIRLEVTLSPSTQQEEMVVTAETPLLDQTKVGTSTVLTEEEMNAVPQSRDPWSIMTTVPGIQTDRINVGGSEAGQQSNFASKGDDGNNAVWVMDGVEFVDPGAQGSSQTYMDFSSFAQMNVTTGGADSNVRSGGAALNFVTKQGANNHQGSIRLLYADEDFQSSHEVLDSQGNVLGGNRIAETFEKSFELGGPIIKDRMWYWGAFSQNSINQLTINGQEDRTELRNVSFKIHGDITSTTRFTAFYTEGDKIKNGRGAGPTRPLNTTWDQSGPTPIYRFEVNQIIGQNTELSLLLGRVDGGFGLIPRGSQGQIGLDQGTNVWDDTSFRSYQTSRPVRQYEVRGNTFLSSTNLDHELQYGVQYREATVNSQNSWGEFGLTRLFDSTGDPGGLAILYRDSNETSDLEYVSANIQDTITYGNWTFKVGLRYDSQEGQNVASTVAANQFAPDILPEFNYPGAPVPFTWETVAPRLGVTYTWGEDSEYLVRGSAGQFYDTLGSSFISPENPVTFRYAYYSWNDLDEDNLVDQGELGDFLGGNSNRSQDVIDPNLDPPRVDELVLGFEWAINPEFTVGVTGTYRERHDDIWTQLNGDLDPDTHYDLVQDTATNPVTGEVVDVSYYVLNDAGAAALNDNNNILTNRPDYTEEYNSIEFTATKRLSNRWMMRANLSIQDWTRNVGEGAIQDPNNFQSGLNEDGAAVGVQSAGSGNRANVFFGSANWTANVNGLYQLPWDLTISANLNAREGFAFPYAFLQQYSDSAGFFNGNNIKFDDFDAERADDVFWADFKLTKTFSLSGRTKVEIAAEVFNAFNDDTIMARELLISTTRAGEPVEVLSPRVGRFSATVHF